MGKVRAKDIKKRTGGDFKRKTAKVGRKIERGNVTKISVVSKRIVLPLQASLSDSRADDAAHIDGLIRLMTHYSSKNRAAALQELQQIFETSPNARKYLGITLPHILELLFDGTAEVHRAMLDLLTSLLNRYEVSDFAAVAPVLVTYICSGLTSLNMAIRKDTLVALHCVCTLQPTLLMNYAEKLFDHLLTLIENSLVENSARDTYSSGVDVVANASAKVTSKVVSASSAKRKKDESADKRKAQKRQHESNVLLLSLKIFVSLLQCMSVDSNSKASADIENRAQLTFGAQLRVVRKNSLLLSSADGASATEVEDDGEGGQSHASVEPTPAGDEGTQDSTLKAGAISLSSPVMFKLCALLRKIWDGYMPQDPAPLPVKLETVLRSMTNVVSILARYIGVDGSFATLPIVDELRKTLHSFAAQFPYSVSETSCVVTSKKKAKRFHIDSNAEPLAVATAAVDAGDDDHGSDSDDSSVDVSVVSAKTQGSVAVVDEMLLREAKNRFSVLNVLISESVINLYADTLCVKYLNTCSRDRYDMKNFLKTYQRVQNFVGKELNSVVNVLNNSSGDRECDLTPKEFYQHLFYCHKLLYVQSNKVKSLFLTAAQLDELCPDGKAQLCDISAALSTLLAHFVQLGSKFRCKGYIPFVESCVRCICGVSEETVARKSLELNLAGQESDGTIVHIASGLSSALTLMNTFPNEPGALTELIANAVVHFTSILNFSEGDSGTEKLQLTVSNLFRPSESSTQDDEIPPMYCRAPTSTRLRFLDIWAVVAPAASFMDDVDDIFECIRSMLYDEKWDSAIRVASEVVYFLRLFHIRRHDTSMGAFKDFIFSSVEAMSATYREIVSEIIARQTHERPVAREVATTMLKLLFDIVKCESSCVKQIVYSIIRCSSPENPQKLLGLLKEHVSTMTSAVEKGIDISEESLDKSRTSQLFLAASDVGALVTVVAEILSSCSQNIAVNEDPDGDLNNCGQTITDLSAKALVGSLLRLHDAGVVSGTSSMDKLCASATMTSPLTAAYFFCHDVVGCMSLLSRQISRRKTGDSDDEEPSLAVFLAFLTEVEAKWSSLELSSKLCVLKVIKEFYRRNEFESCMAESRSKLDEILTRLKSQEVAVDIVENVVELLQFISA